MGRGQTLDAVPCHYSFQAWLWLHCVWHSIKHQPTTTGQHSLLWTETGMGAFCTSPVSSLYTEADEAPLEEHRLKLSMRYYVKTRACIDNPAHHALHEFDQTINRHFQNGETTCCQLSKRLPDNSTIFSAETTAISLALNYYQHVGPVHHDVVVYSDSMFISWTCSGHWVTRAHVFVSAGYQATVALTEMKE